MRDMKSPWIASYAVWRPSKRAMGLSMNFPLRGRKVGAGAALTGPGITTRVRTGSTRPKETPPMTGIQFITDGKGRKTAAVIDLKTHKALWEDIEDILISRSRRNEKRIPLENVKADLIKSGKLRGEVFVALTTSAAR